jgi:hypothetical protein
MAQKLSKNHHYLPRCYLKSFTHNGRQLYIYDKKKDEIRAGNINNSFTLWQRNTVTFPNGEKSDLLEKEYARIESESAYLFPKIINSTPKESAYDYTDMLQLSFFIAALFWRVPSIDSHVQKLIAQEGFANRRFHIVYPEGWPETERKRFETELLGLPVSQKFYHLMLIFEPYYGKNYSKFINDWKFYYHDPGRFFAGDNPIITRSVTEPKAILDEFVFPLAPNRVLVASNGEPLQIEKEWALNVDLQLIKQSERYVCSNDELFLRAIVNLYKLELLAPQPTNFKAKIFQEVD